MSFLLRFKISKKCTKPNTKIHKNTKVNKSHLNTEAKRKYNF